MVSFVCLWTISQKLSKVKVFQKLRGTIFHIHLCQILKSLVVINDLADNLFSFLAENPKLETVKQKITWASDTTSSSLLHASYNFHYYVNIFLLAIMSVERCVAVWKSLRCQRYQFNVSRKVIKFLESNVTRSFLVFNLISRKWSHTYIGCWAGQTGRRRFTSDKMNISLSSGLSSFVRKP